MTGIKIDKVEVLKILATKKWTYSDLANEMNITKQSISVHLMGKKNIRLTTLYLFADALGVEANTLIKE